MLQSTKGNTLDRVRQAVLQVGDQGSDTGAECSKQGKLVSITQRLCNRNQLEMIKKQKGAHVTGAQWMRERATGDEAREVSKGPIPQSLVRHKEETGFY